MMCTDKRKIRGVKVGRQSVLKNTWNRPEAPTARCLMFWPNCLLFAFESADRTPKTTEVKCSRSGSKWNQIKTNEIETIGGIQFL